MRGFLHQAATTAAGLGRPNLPVAVVPGHVDTQELSDLERNVREITVPAVLVMLKSPSPKPATAMEMR